jgi:hypothetical protein
MRRSATDASLIMGSRQPPREERTGPRGERYRGPPMDLRDMRAQGVRSLWVSCTLCHHSAVMNVDRFGDAVTVPSFGPRMVCTGCGIVGADARPNWQERPPSESITGMQWGQR